MKKTKNEYALVFEFFWKRLKAPLKSVAFVLYFITVILVIGLSASFISLYDSYDYEGSFDLENISLSLVGYGIVLLCSSAIELIFLSLDHEDEKDLGMIKNGITMIGVSSILIGLIFSIIIYVTTVTWIKFTLSILITLGSLFLWWISNARSLSLLKSAPPPDKSETTGGEAVSDYTLLSGEIPKDFKS
jgi:hypothetical protein